MIHPIRPVTLSAAGGCHPLAVLRYDLLCAVARNRCRLVIPPWQWMAECLGAGAALPEPALRELVPLAVTESCPLPRWMPWPAHEPFADEVDRWWPSDEFPPEQPPIIIEDQSPSPPVQIINWQSVGGVLDMLI